MESIWTLINPVEEPFYAKSLADEYITMNEAAKRLNVPIAQIKDWIVDGLRYPSKGWKQGIHYIILDYSTKENKVNAEMFIKKHQKLIRIPWNAAMRHITLREQGTRKVQVIDLIKAKSTSTSLRYSETNFYEFEDEKPIQDLANVEELSYDDEEEEADDIS